MKNIQNQINALLDEAMKQPGVADVMRLYDLQRPALEAYVKAQQAVAPRWVVFSSTSSSRSVK